MSNSILLVKGWYVFLTVLDLKKIEKRLYHQSLLSGAHRRDNKSSNGCSSLDLGGFNYPICHFRQNLHIFEFLCAAAKAVFLRLRINMLNAV